MSGPPRATSSAAAEAVEEALLRADDTINGRGLGGGVPLVDLECTPKDDAVGTREHVARAAGERVANLGLRFEDGELTAHRVQVQVTKEVAASKACAIENQGFRQRRQFDRRRKLADFEPAAGNLNVSD